MDYDNVKLKDMFKNACKNKLAWEIDLAINNDKHLSKYLIMVFNLNIIITYKKMNIFIYNT